LFEREAGSQKTPLLGSEGGFGYRGRTGKKSGKSQDHHAEEDIFQKRRKGQEGCDFNNAERKRGRVKVDSGKNPVKKENENCAYSLQNRTTLAKPETARKKIVEWGTVKRCEYLIALSLKRISKKKKQKGERREISF